MTRLHNVTVLGDALEVLRHLPSDTMQLTFTSPPYYNAREYAHYADYPDYLNFLAAVGSEIFRVTQPGRFFVLNTSPILVPRLNRAHASQRYAIPFDIHPRLIDTGWEFIDDIVWVKPEPSSKNRNAGFAQHRKPLAYKPNAITEYLMVYRKPSGKLIDHELRQYPADIVAASLVSGKYESSNVWAIAPARDLVHSAVFPEDLCQRVIQYYSYVGDLVLDPFAGSGTVGRVAYALGRRYFMSERNPRYVERIQQTLLPILFEPCIPQCYTFAAWREGCG